MPPSSGTNLSQGRAENDRQTAVQGGETWCVTNMGSETAANRTGAEMRGIQVLGITGILFGLVMYFIPFAILYWLLGLLGMVAVWIILMWIVTPRILTWLEDIFGP